MWGTWCSLPDDLFSLAGPESPQPPPNSRMAVDSQLPNRGRVRHRSGTPPRGWSQPLVDWKPLKLKTHAPDGYKHTTADLQSDSKIHDFNHAPCFARIRNQSWSLSRFRGDSCLVYNPIFGCKSEKVILHRNFCRVHGLNKIEKQNKPTKTVNSDGQADISLVCAKKFLHWKLIWTPQFFHQNVESLCIPVCL